MKCDTAALILSTTCRHLRLPQDVEETLKILVMMPKQLAAELASEESVVPAQNTLDAGNLCNLYASFCLNTYCA